MADFLKAVAKGVRAGVSAARETKPARIEVAGRPVTCPHCANQTFFQRVSNWVAPGSALAGENTLTLTCEKCGRMEWFCVAVAPKD